MAEKAEMDEKFQFLLCEKCQREVKAPKLLPCLHNLCTECLEKKPISLCPICETVHSPDAAAPLMQDNLLFANLQAKLSIYQKVVGGQDLICDNCKKKGDFWCADCEEFICASCYESHQRYLKRESHEAKALKDLRTESSQEFLAGLRKLSVMFCSKEDHKTQMLSIYCNECRQSMCCVCALLDSKHMGQHQDIRTEIQSRQEQLRSMSAELKEKKSSYDATYNNLQELVGNMEKARNEMREQIQQKIDEMVRMLKEKGERFLAEVEDQHKQEIQKVMKKLQEMEGMVKRMVSSEQLVEKMHLYASDQEVLEMQPFLRRSLEELQKKEPPAVDFQIQVGKFAEINSQLQALFERVTKEKEAVPAKLETAPNEVNNVSAGGNQSCRTGISQNACRTADHAAKLPAKRKRLLEERAIQASPKVIKTEPVESEGLEPAWRGSDRLLEQPGPSSESAGSDCARGSGGSLSGSTDRDSWLAVSSSSSESSDPEDVTLVDVSSEEEVTDNESVGSSLLKDLHSRAQSSQEGATSHPFSRAQELDAGQGTMVFFDMKFLPGRILHLVAVAEEANCLSVMIQPLLSSPVGDMKCSLCEIGLDQLLSYLRSLRRPILVGHRLWSMELPLLVESLQNINKEEQLEASILGFLDALPLIKEKIPKIASYSLKNLDSTYLWGQLDDSHPADCARTLKDLCTVLEINPVVERRPVVAYASLQCYTSLQPLLREKFLSWPSVQTLALHQVSLALLQSVYQNNPAKGLQKLCRYLNARRRQDERKIQKLSKIRSYFQAQLPMAQPWLPAAAQSAPFPPTSQLLP
ncbi:protein PML-like [Elgaria multicarinata webbii]|uniref:protein PML-like n=1 Tax=Elgaria multicarinata webbii TaxID=159646 RepID=UPI002FCD35A2